MGTVRAVVPRVLDSGHSSILKELKRITPEDRSGTQRPAS